MTGRRRPLRERLEAAWWRHTQAPELLALAADPSPTVRAAVAGRNVLPEEVADVLVRDPRPAVRKAWARNPSCPPRLLAVLVDDPSTGVSVEVPTNPATDDVVVARILASPRALLRSMLVDHPALTPEWELALARDADAAVREKVAELTSRPEVLALLVADPRPGVRCCTIVNPLTTSAQLGILARDPSRGVREAVRWSGRVHD